MKFLYKIFSICFFLPLSFFPHLYPHRSSESFFFILFIFQLIDHWDNLFGFFRGFAHFFCFFVGYTNSIFLIFSIFFTFFFSAYFFPFSSLLIKKFYVSIDELKFTERITTKNVNRKKKLYPLLTLLHNVIYFFFPLRFSTFNCWLKIRHLKLSSR